MIIFNLDGTLANCEHRRHFVQPTCSECKSILDDSIKFDLGWHCDYPCDNVTRDWEPDWKAFYEACDKDEPNWPIINLCNELRTNHHVEIWSGRCTSVQWKTVEWLNKYICCNKKTPRRDVIMRHIGDSTADDVLKERWLDEYLALPLYPNIDEMEEGKTYYRRDPIEMIFDSDPKSVAMWRRRGITCLQVNDGDF